MRTYLVIATNTDEEAHSNCSSKIFPHVQKERECCLYGTPHYVTVADRHLLEPVKLPRNNQNIRLRQHESMDKPSDLYEYTDELTGDQIRVIELQPGEEFDPIECNLLSTRLDGKLAFKALSYAWGDRNVLEYILVSGKPFAVTLSLYEALHHIRCANEVQLIWVDAVCIDQGHIEERNHQVQQMGRIYSEAEEVIAWLDLPTPGRENATTDVGKLVSPLHDVTITDVNRLSWAVLDLLDRSWFGRLWVFQECALARRCLFLIGRQSLDLECLLRICSTSHVRKGIAEVVTDTKRRRNFRRVVRFLVMVKRFRSCLLTGKAWNQAYLMGELRHLMCFDPRDHVFGLVGVAHADGVPCDDVDYSKDVVDVFTTATRNQLLNSRSGFNMLTKGGAERVLAKNTVRASWIDEMPSWVVDWSGTSARPHLAKYSDWFEVGGHSRKILGCGRIHS